MNNDVINGQTPLEIELADVHPRLFLTGEKIADLRNRIGDPPLSPFFERMKDAAAEGAVAHAALCYLLTEEEKYLDAARDGALNIVNNTEWPEDVRGDGAAFRDQLFDMALAYDWLYHVLDGDTLAALRERLNDNGRKNFEALARHEIYQSDIYTCNTLAACIGNTAAAGLAIYGDVDDVGPWLRSIIERARLMTDALGPDGVSQEGICYGGFYTEYYFRVVVLVRELLGWDFLKGNEYLRSVPYFYIYSMLPYEHMTNSTAHIGFGDCVRYNWHGPDYTLRGIAAEYGDSYAQRAADIQSDTGATAVCSNFLNLAWYDADVPAVDLADLPTFRHFDDKDLVFMRSGWDGDEAIFAFKCGPHSGHHALRNYQHCIGGGHMAPDAGSFKLFAHGDYLIDDGWYAMKFTSSRNTVLVNGIGQTGEGGEWFECTQLRRERRGPRILRAEHGDDRDYVVGDVAPAYEHEAGLKKFLRHVTYLRPSCWVIVDELETVEPSTFELFFHAYGQQFKTDRPFEPAGDLSWTTGGEKGKVRITALLPSDVDGHPGIQRIRGIGTHEDRDMCILRLVNAEKACSAVFVTVLEAYPASGAPGPAPSIQRADGEGALTLNIGGNEQRITGK